MTGLIQLSEKRQLSVLVEKTLDELRHDATYPEHFW